MYIVVPPYVPFITTFGGTTGHEHRTRRAVCLVAAKASPFLAGDLSLAIITRVR